VEENFSSIIFDVLIRFAIEREIWQIAYGVNLFSTDEGIFQVS